MFAGDYHLSIWTKEKMRLFKTHVNSTTVWTSTKQTETFSPFREHSRLARCSCWGAIFVSHHSKPLRLTAERVLGSRMKGSDAVSKESFLKRYGFSEAAQSKGGLLAKGMLSALIKVCLLRDHIPVQKKRIIFREISPLLPLNEINVSWMAHSET